MGHFVLAFAFALTATTAWAGPSLILQTDHIGCATLAPYTELMMARNNPAEMKRLYQEFKSQTLCVDLPRGTQVTVEQVNGRFRCLKPVGWSFCGWTLVFDAQGRVVLP